MLSWLKGWMPVGKPAFRLGAGDSFACNVFVDGAHPSALAARVQGVLDASPNAVVRGWASAGSGLPNGVDIKPRGQAKDAGIRQLITHLAAKAGGGAGAPTLGAADVIAFGDDFNDLEMLRWAGLGVAMGNAEAAAKEAADRVAATNDEDGVARVLEEMLASSASVREFGGASAALRGTVS